MITKYYVGFTKDGIDDTFTELVSCHFEYYRSEYEAIQDMLINESEGTEFFVITGEQKIISRHLIMLDEHGEKYNLLVDKNKYKNNETVDEKSDREVLLELVNALESQKPNLVLSVYAKMKLNNAKKRLGL